MLGSSTATRWIRIAFGQPLNQHRHMLFRLLILSLLDASLTLWGLGQGAIEEVNPVMRWFIEKSPITFMSSSCLPIMLGFVLWEIRDRSRKFVAWSLGLVLIVYAVVMVLHVYWLVF